ncbi:MAG: hypothetical protein AAB296_01215 [Candidatus Desantisbacteria bacterium]
MSKDISVIIVVMISLIASLVNASDVQQKDAMVGLNVPQVIELLGIDMEESITPGPEDYARDLDIWRVVNDLGGGWHAIIAVEYDSCPCGSTTHVYNLPFAQTSPWKNTVPQGGLSFSCSDFNNKMGVSGNVTYEQLLHLRDIASTHSGTWRFHFARVQETFVRTASNNTGNEAAVNNAMYDNNNDIGKGFAERTNAISMTIFSNAQDGAVLYVHGNTPAGPKGILRLDDTYISVSTEMTYLMNTVKKEGVAVDAGSMNVQENKVNPHSSSTERVVFDPYEDRHDDPLIDRLTIEVNEVEVEEFGMNDTGGKHRETYANRIKEIFCWLLAGCPVDAYALGSTGGQKSYTYQATETWDSYYVYLNPSSSFHHEGLEPHLGRVDYNIEEAGNPPGSTQKAWSCWLRLHNQSQSILEVKMATVTPRLIVFNLGVANLARYTEGNYSNILTFTLMPIVG